MPSDQLKPGWRRRENAALCSQRFDDYDMAVQFARRNEGTVEDAAGNLLRDFRPE